MILFDLQCDKNHKFECWFASSANYEEQLKNKMIVIIVSHNKDTLSICDNLLDLNN